MMSGLINLLPPSRLKAFRRLYFARLATVGILLLSMVVVIHTILLVPSYLFLDQVASSKTLELQHLSSTLQTSEEKKAQLRVAALQDEVQHLSALDTLPHASTALRAVLAVPRAGITLNGFTFTPSTLAAHGPSTMQLVGVASTRETLRAYDDSLAALPFITNADLPISAYAAASNIPFTITLKGSFKP